MAKKMNNKPYPNWVGVILGFLLNGSAHFLAGQRAAGILWYFTISLTAIVGALILVIPGELSYVLSLILFLSSIALWLIMLKQSYRPVKRIGIKGWLAVLVIYIILSFGGEMAFKQFIRPFNIESGAMIPSLMPGDQILSESISYRLSDPKRGDIVVFNTSGINYSDIHQDSLFVKRIVGLPGETVQIKPPYLLINGDIVTEPAAIKSITTSSNGFVLAHNTISSKALLTDPEDTIRLGTNEYFTIGDNTAVSLDGRHYGSIKREQIYGKVSRIYWPISRISK